VRFSRSGSSHISKHAAAVLRVAAVVQCAGAASASGCAQPAVAPLLEESSEILHQHRRHPVDPHGRRAENVRRVRSAYSKLLKSKARRIGPQTRVGSSDGTRFGDRTEVDAYIRYGEAPQVARESRTCVSSPPPTGTATQPSRILLSSTHFSSGDWMGSPPGSLAVPGCDRLFPDLKTAGAIGREIDPSRPATNSGPGQPRCLGEQLRLSPEATSQMSPCRLSLCGRPSANVKAMRSPSGDQRGGG
jgi:hypothetical protein